MVMLYLPDFIFQANSYLVLVSRQLLKEIVQIMAELGHIFPDSSEELVGAFRV